MFLLKIGEIKIETIETIVFGVWRCKFNVDGVSEIIWVWVNLRRVV